MTAAQKQEAISARESLLKFVQPGATVFCVLKHVSRSGMSRVISMYARDGERMQWLDGWASRLGLGTLDREREGIKVGGCGMDMGFHLVSNLSAALWPEGFGCTGERCPSNQHSNGDRDYTPHCLMVALGKGAHWHTEADYALRHQWL